VEKISFTDSRTKKLFCYSFFKNIIIPKRLFSPSENSRMASLQKWKVESTEDLLVNRNIAGIRTGYRYCCWRQNEFEVLYAEESNKRLNNHSLAIEHAVGQWPLTNCSSGQGVFKAKEKKDQHMGDIIPLLQFGWDSKQWGFNTNRAEQHCSLT